MFPGIVTSNAHSVTGPPQLKFLMAMDQEHRMLPGHDYVFTTTNYGIETCPTVEWRLLELRQGKTWDAFIKEARIELPKVELSSTEFQPEFQPESNSGWNSQLSSCDHPRYIPDVNKLLELDSSKSAELKLEEVIAVVLYTGPMVSLSRCAEERCIARQVL
jgi:hypothetical protein